MDKVIKRRGNSLVIIFDKEDIKLKNLAEGKVIRLDLEVVGEIEVPMKKPDDSLPGTSLALEGHQTLQEEKVSDKKLKLD